MRVKVTLCMNKRLSKYALLVEVRHLFIVCQRIHVYTDLCSRLFSPELQFQKLLERRMNYHRFNGQEQERFYEQNRHLTLS